MRTEGGRGPAAGTLALVSVGAPPYLLRGVRFLLSPGGWLMLHITVPQRRSASLSLLAVRALAAPSPRIALAAGARWVARPQDLSDCFSDPMHMSGPQQHTLTVVGRLDKQPNVVFLLSCSR